MAKRKSGINQQAPGTGRVRLREVRDSDLPLFFEHQLDPVANQMAAFTAEDPSDKKAFMARWAKILGDETITKRSILYEGQVVGHVVRFEQFGQPEVSYWFDKQYWGLGLATEALTEFLKEVTTRPLYARAAKDHIASIRVLEKCGFAICGEDKGFANARGREIEEYILKLDTAKRYDTDQ
jgi:RimJ/RimL family protein N-acetyltransferase